MIECGNCEERLYPDPDGRLRHDCESSRSPGCYDPRVQGLLADMEKIANSPSSDIGLNDIAVNNLQAMARIALSRFNKWS